MHSVSARILDSAGIADPALRAAYERCRRLASSTGGSYRLATRLLPREKRPHVWAVCGFARRAAGFVTTLGASDAGPAQAWAAGILDALGGAPSDDPVVPAMLHTMRRWQIPRIHVEAFLTSARADLAATAYPAYADLERYLYGSAAAIGLQLLPILEPLNPEAASRARALAEACRLSALIGDIGRDLQRGRIYLPQEDLDTFGVTREALGRGAVTPLIRELIRFEIERARALYAFAEPGVAMLHPTSRESVHMYGRLSAGTLERIERAGYQVLTQRVSVPWQRRWSVALPAMGRARAARRAERRWVSA